MNLASTGSRLLVGALAALTLAACTGSAAEPGTATGAGPLRAATGTLPRLVFFINPYGMPCQLQDRVLKEMSSELAGRVEIVYVRTTEPADHPTFGRYGIRALPTLVLTDAAGQELRRATPGVQTADQVRRLIGG